MVSNQDESCSMYDIERIMDRDVYQVMVNWSNPACQVGPYMI